MSFIWSHKVWALMKTTKDDKTAEDIADGVILSDEEEPTQLVDWNEIPDPLSSQAKEMLVKKSSQSRGNDEEI